jgi:macrolide transport system ATP-binding/permease protein
LILAGGVMPLTAEERASSYAASMIVGGLVLMLACANLANLVLARGNHRRKEIAIRLSVGASRLRVVRQFLTESLMLACAGALGSLVFTYWLLRFFTESAARIGQEPAEFGYHVDLWSVVFAAIVSVIAGMGFGLLPAFASTRTDLATALKEGAAATFRGYRRFGIRNLFVGAQVAASLTLLLLTSYLVVGYEKTRRLDPGFDLAGLYLFQIDPARNGYSAEQAQDLFSRLPDRLAAAGSMTIAESIPLVDFMVTPNTRIAAPSAQGVNHQVLTSVVERRIGAHYFTTLGIPLVLGREFAERDVNDSVSKSPVLPPVIVNQTAARELFSGNDPIGRTVRKGNQSYTVIGVARDTKSALMLANPVPTLYLPMQFSSNVTVILRGAHGSDTMSTVRAELASMDSGLAVFNARTMGEALEQMNALIHLSSVFYLAVGIFGLILASIGLAGVTAYAVVQRRKEIGIRMALGACRRQILQLVLKEGMALVAVGSVLGFGAAYAASHALAYTTETLARAFAMGTGDLRLIIGVPLLLVAIAMAACYIPARRSTRIAPLAALRDE